MPLILREGIHPATTIRISPTLFDKLCKVPYPDPYSMTVKPNAIPENPTKAEAIAEDVYYDLSDIDAKDLRSVAVADGRMYFNAHQPTQL